MTPIVDGPERKASGDHLCEFLSADSTLPRELHVLVTGGSGFVGRAVVAALLERGHRVTATTTSPPEQLPAHPRLQWTVWDGMAQPAPPVRWEGIDVIAHLAAPPPPLTFPDRATALYELTVAASFRLLEAARTSGVRRALFASTGDVLREGDCPATEADILYQPPGFYGTVKACGELLFRSYEPVLSTAILRLYHPYGPGGEKFLVQRLMQAVRERKEITIDGPQGILLNPIWSQDLAKGICLAVESEEVGIFHFGGPEYVTLRRLLELMGELVGAEPIIRVGPQRPSGSHAGSYELTRRRLGFHPQVSVRDGLSMLLTLARLPDTPTAR